MKEFLAKLDGYKTHIGVILGGLLGICFSAGWVDAPTAGVIASVVATWTGVAVRDAWRKAEIGNLEPGELMTSHTYRVGDLVPVSEINEVGKRCSTTPVYETSGVLVGYRIESVAENPQ